MSWLILSSFILVHISNMGVMYVYLLGKFIFFSLLISFYYSFLGFFD